MVKELTLIIPNTSWYGRYWHSFPYTEGLLSAILKKEGYETKIIDANLEKLSKEDFAKRINKENLKIAGISAMTLEYRP
jgi:hypothetical protein